MASAWRRAGEFGAQIGPRRRRWRHAKHDGRSGQAGQLELHQRLCFGGGEQRRQGPRQALVHRLVEGRAVQLQLRRPAPGQPLHLRGEETVVDGGARDAAGGQRGAVRQQIGTLRKGIQHQRCQLLHRRVVGVGAQPAQRLVQVQHRRRPCQPRARELPHQREFAHRQAGPVLARQALQGRQGTG